MTASFDILHRAMIARVEKRELPGMRAVASFRSDRWSFGMAVTVAPDDVSPAPGRYGWAGGYGTTWFNAPHRRLIAIGLTQTVGFLWNALGEFQELVARAADDMR